MDPRGQCTDITLLLPWFVNGSLEPAERRMVRNHLINCPTCRRELAQTRLARKLFATEDTAGTTNIQHLDVNRRRVASTRKWYLAAAAVLTLCLTSAGIWIGQSASVPQQPQQVAVDRMTFETPGDEPLFVTVGEPEQRDASAGRRELAHEAFEHGSSDNAWKFVGFAESDRDAHITIGS